MNQEGDVLQTHNRGLNGSPIYDGLSSLPAPDAAFETGSTGSITGQLSINGNPAASVDGLTWLPIN